MVDQTAPPAGMQLDDPQRAAQAALGSLPAGEQAGLDGDAPASSTAGQKPVDERALRLELRGMIGSFDWLATSSLGPKMALKPDEKHELEEAWLPYALETGRIMPTWLSATLVTLMIYGPRTVAVFAEWRADGELASEADAAAE